MRSQLERRHLMPMFGAGMSQPLKLPNWSDLIDRLSAHKKVKGDKLRIQRSSHTSRTQMLFQHFRRNQLEKKFGSAPNGIRPTASDERLILAEWMKVVHECLYKYALPAEKHPYLKAFLPVIQAAPLTVNYNFDDYIQEFLDGDSSVQGDDQRRGYETVWEPTVQYRYSSSVIYHPNGFLPRRLERGSSDSVVFAEDSFADQLIDAQRGHYSTLLSHMFRFTGLLIGLSLDDPTLKHLLRQSVHSNPGHIHYYVAFLHDDDQTHPHRKAATSDSNFETYNLVTLYLKSADFLSLATLLTMEEREFACLIDEAQLPKSYTYYLSGAIGTGKTSSLAHFKNLNTYDEWLAPKPRELHQAANTLTTAERVKVDEWVSKQFRQKNLLVSRCEGTINVIDRSPLDPLAFAKNKDTRGRLDQLRGSYLNSKGKVEIVDGKVIFMTGNPEVLHVRVQQRHKNGDAGYIHMLQQRFKALWSSTRKGVHVLNTVDLPLAAVVKRIARIIHLEEYQAVDLSDLAKKDLAKRLDAAKK